ncbi:MAG: hypothetical protein ACK40P_13700 [Pseudanabaena sp.]|jgi:hypothetical protein
MAIFIVPFAWVVGSLVFSAVAGSVAGKAIKIKDEEGSVDLGKAVGKGVSHTLKTGVQAGMIIGAISKGGDAYSKISKK